MKSDNTRAIFTKQNQHACHKILNDIDTWISSKFSESQATIDFQPHSPVKVFTSTIDQRKSQHQVKFNAYAQRISKRFCSINPNESGESFDTSPLRIPKYRINVSCIAAVTSQSPTPAPSENNHAISPPNIDMLDMSLHIPTPNGVNSSRLTELESSLLSIQSERTSMQSDQTQLQNEFQKVLTGVLKHSKESQAMQSEVHGLTTMMQDICNAIFPNAPHLPPRPPFAIEDNISSHQYAPMLGVAPYSPPRKKPYHGDESPSTSLHTTTEDLQIESGTSSNPRECVIDTPIGLDQY
jgi:hypothetical protein